MKNIPFPNPHDADALNDYLDALAAGKQVSPEDDVQKTAADVQALANRHMPSVPEYSTGSHTGGENMQTAAYSPPISNRTRRARAATPKKSRLEPWLSGLLIAGLLVSMIGYTRWNGPGGGEDNNNLAWAPQTASPIAEEAFVWTAPISSKECPEDESIPNFNPDNPSGTRYTQADYDAVSVERSYEIVGPADPSDAKAVVTKIRESYGCIAVGKSIPLVTARHEYESRTTAGRESLESISGERTQASETVSNWLEIELGLTPIDMYVVQDRDESELDGTEALITQGLYNPDQAVLFADGRIGVIPSAVSYSGFPVAISDETVPGYGPNMIIFVFQNGEWLIDESLPICLGDCSATTSASPVGIDGDVPIATPTATPEM